MKKCLVIGGSNGIGLAMALQLKQQGNDVRVVDRVPSSLLQEAEVDVELVNLITNDFSFLHQYDDIDVLILTSGFGRVAPFEQIAEKEIDNGFQVNAVSVLKVLHHYFPRMQRDTPFYCAVMGSIAGLVSSPLIALYGATKAAVCNGVESLNIELEKAGSANRILCVSPGSIKGTRFNGGENDLSLTEGLAKEILERMFRCESLFIPQYEEIYKGVLTRYHSDPHQFGTDSYDYKMKCGRMTTRPQLKVGYLSGTFDLFHIGHLNMLRRAKQYCDYLVVGVHKDASHKGKEAFIPFEERVDIVRSIGFVDEVIESLPEDSDVWTTGLVKYDYLFVGSDYKGTERFNRYEEYFKDKAVEIIYFPYTNGTSSTQLREALDKVRQS